MPVGLETLVTIQSLGAHPVFQSGESYDIGIIPMNHPADELLGEAYPRRTIRAEGGRLCLRWLFSEEQEYSLRVIMDEQGSYLVMRVYALREDLYARRPLRGDLHAHSTVSDGGEAPPVVAAHYRRAGYDFLALTDHCEYSGSAEAQRFYADKPIDLLLVGGEEIHSPAIVSAVRDGYSVAVDAYRGQTPRVHGSFRMVSYALFLLSEYFPLHDELCYEEGRVMKALAAGDDEQAGDLQRMQGRTGRLADKHFGGGRRKL